MKKAKNHGFFTCIITTMIYYITHKAARPRCKEVPDEREENQEKGKSEDGRQQGEPFPERCGGRA
jgi:hypothetical protein